MGTDYDSWLLGVVEGDGADPCETCGDHPNDCECDGEEEEPDWEKFADDRDRDRWERFLERI